MTDKRSYEAPRIRWTCEMPIEDGAVRVDERLWDDESGGPILRFGLAMKRMAVDLVRYPNPLYASFTLTRIPWRSVRRAAGL